MRVQSAVVQRQAVQGFARTSVFYYGSLSYSSKNPSHRYEYNVLLTTSVLLTVISLFYYERRSVSPDPANWWVTSSVYACLGRSPYRLSLRNRKACRGFRMTSSIRAIVTYYRTAAKIHLMRLGKSLRVSKVEQSELICIFTATAHAWRCPT